MVKFVKMFEKKNLAAIDSVEDCINLSDLILSHNEINDIYGLEKCRELWRFDINNNRVCFIIMCLFLFLNRIDIIYVINKIVKKFRRTF